MEAMEGMRKNKFIFFNSDSNKIAGCFSKSISNLLKILYPFHRFYPCELIAARA